MTGREGFAAGRFGVAGAMLLLVRRQFWAIALVLAVSTLAALAYSRMQGPLHEATAVVQVRPGVDVAAAKALLTSRQNLLAMVMRHGLTTSQSDGSLGRAAVVLRQSIAVHDLTVAAGKALGLDGEVAGIVVSVLLPDADLATRVSNDLAQQLLDLGNAGGLQQGQADLLFYRREELRLWQETSALRGELDGLAASSGEEEEDLHNVRRLALMVDQYDHVRRKLAEAEVGARLAFAGQGAGFSLLRRATLAEAVPLWQSWRLVGVAGCLLLAVALGFVLERRSQVMAGDLAALRRGFHGFGLIWRLVDDPARPILGVPRYLVISAGVVVGLVGAARLLA